MKKNILYSDNNEIFDHFDHEGEIYQLSYIEYPDNTIGYKESIPKIELYSDFKLAEKRVDWLLKHRERFSDYSIRNRQDIEYRDFGIKFIATTADKDDYSAVVFIIEFARVYNTENKW
jgi:hypothetical protein